MIEDIRTGIGFDVHAFAKDRKLILGGVEIPNELGLLGHSDADVLLHSIADALLGALALGDIGKHFPDTDPKYKDVQSSIILKKVFQLVSEKGYHLNNLDVALAIQKPKVSPYIEQMRNNIALILQTEYDNISIKATTTEKLGFVGREEGIASFAIVLIAK